MSPYISLYLPSISQPGAARAVRHLPPLNLRYVSLYLPISPYISPLSPNQPRLARLVNFLPIPPLCLPISPYISPLSPNQARLARFVIFLRYTSAMSPYISLYLPSISQSGAARALRQLPRSALPVRGQVGNHGDIGEA